MLKLAKYFKWWYYPLIILIVALIYIQIEFDLRLIDKVADIIRSIGIADTTGTPQTDEILSIGLSMILITLVSISTTILASFLASRIGANLSKNLRKQLYLKVDGFSLEEINQFSTSSLITRTSNDIQQVQMVMIILLRMAITAPMMAIRGVLKISGLSNELSIITAIGVIFILTVISVIFVFVTPKFKVMQEQNDELNLVTRENLVGLRVVRAHNAQEIEKDKFENINERITRLNLFVNRGMQLLMPNMALAMNGVSLAIVWLAAVLINQGNLGQNGYDGIAIQTQFTTYSMQILISFMMLTMLFIMIPRGQVSAKRIREVLNTKTKIKDPVNPKTINKEEAIHIKFEDVCFKYPNAEECVIENVNFEANMGQTVAFIGSTGSGKSTIINLIPRFYDVTHGSIKINDIDIRDLKQTDLIDLVGYVPQKGMLFQGDIQSNLRLGNEHATDEELLSALEISQSKEFVMALEDNLNAPVSQGGKNFSGGQRQRLCIARTIVKQPKIYIFDDSFSALDYQTDRKLRRELEKTTKNAIKLIVAQRISTILHADQIVVLENGKIVGKGTHKELLKTNHVYQEMAYSQLSEEELAHE
ncbi:ABC transporter, ATP-binding protein [Paracholeplasma brassicae]|uniref:ABC transporter, ATP-binding protein n=1 Tax=Acholeplasma brassicae TaxID=61635 RepID=U4KRF1_9MOLU|nr:ABC transporter ATP-binding protein [Paracholeplasma brassicae]CCV65693.1 ABC transporter, ATP-binding protein [Paracholeplasma brassicae]